MGAEINELSSYLINEVVVRSCDILFNYTNIY